MAEGWRFAVDHQLDIGQILLEAKNRWLRPSEICEILRNYKNFTLTPDPPYKPSSGSLFLFDRKVLRYFRKDGHSWRKKKDGKTVREAHEKLKCGSIDVLHCYYAHGEDNENFQRRSYWMLDGHLEHIVLVHYRDVNEGSSSSMPHLLNSNMHNAQHSSAHTLSSELEGADSGDDYSGLSKPLTSLYSRQGHSQNSTLHEDHYKIRGTSQSAGFCGGTDCVTTSTAWRETPDSVLGFNTSTNGIFLNDTLLQGPTGSSMTRAQVKPSCSANANSPVSHNSTVGTASVMHCVPDEHHFPVAPQFKSDRDCQADFAAADQPLEFLKEASYSKQNTAKGNIGNGEFGELKKLDSFGRWMNNEIGRDCDNSLMASDSGSYWNTIDTQNDDKEVTSLSVHMQLDTESLGPSISQEQLFSILDFSPDWAYSDVETKVLISGTFLGGINPNSIKWCCMFGEYEVSAEVLTENVLRCRAPPHTPGRVPFYITRSNRLACSEVREFEYREGLSNGKSLSRKRESGDEIHLHICFAKMLTLGVVACSLEGCHNCARISDLILSSSRENNGWGEIELQSKAFQRCQGDLRDALIQKLLEGKLVEWLACRAHEESKGPNVLDEDGMGVIHYASALGYEWAINLIVGAGVNPNFRDARGRTGLHWAAFYGREEAVVTLLKLGAAPGLVEDPSSAYPEGRTAADLASSRGHKGIGGYLAEADLTSHLSTITLEESIIDNVAANLAAERAIEKVSAQSLVPLDGEEELVPLRGSLAAVRNSAQAAARIQAAFRMHSFRQRELIKSRENPEIPSEVLIASSLCKVLKIDHFNDSLHAAAAVKIQQKFRGWKGRKDFLKIRNRIVKIQAHVRGHQVRRQYRKVVWSVSIVEKAILRWRRKGSGLRGYRADKPAAPVAADIGPTDDYEYLRLGRKLKVAGVEKALARVQSMVRHPEGRDQYMRLLASSCGPKFGDGQSSSAQVQCAEEKRVAEDLLKTMTD
ncbi:calmodulin-binding transcription activator 2-like isoform X2 [Dioscorea cayenensis subsp. rotundata]|uniref:Calmodulin-binding transcription activator 2-like isoform X2 n=1 Tax=Dioscorea cayennensis subsp. rotundata TaxID=55577 RepID=A0AB40BJN9_DIOCR|nr:calmodulin-binding transcription activator 2-like isoform X2 [Dioscorea cayenensis subsp. rotundata]